MPFPPGKESLYLPAQLVDQRDLFGGEIKAAGGHPIGFAFDGVPPPCFVIEGWQNVDMKSFSHFFLSGKLFLLNFVFLACFLMANKGKLIFQCGVFSHPNLSFFTLAWA